MNATTADGCTGVSAMALSIPEWKIKRKDVKSLRNYLHHRFKLFIDMKIDHSEEIDGHIVSFEAKKNKFFIDNNDLYSYNLSDVAWRLVNFLRVKNPNARKEWIKIP